MSPLLSCRDGRAHRGWPRRNLPESGRDPVAVTLAQRRLKVRTLGVGSEKNFSAARVDAVQRNVFADPDAARPGRETGRYRPP